MFEGKTQTSDDVASQLASERNSSSGCAVEYMKSIFESTSNQPVRPGSAPTGRGPLEAAPLKKKSTNKVASMNQSPPMYATSHMSYEGKQTVISASNGLYDAAISPGKIPVDAWVDTSDKRRKRSPTAMRDVATRLSSGMSAVPSSRASSAPRRRKQTRELKRSRSFSDLPLSARRSKSVGRGCTVSVNAAPVSVTSADSPSKLKYLQDLVDDLVRNAVRQADSYYNIQVRLGFVEPSSLLPPRGEIINPSARIWLTSSEIRAAFVAGRLRLTDSQIVVLMKNVQLYAMAQQQNISEVDFDGIEANAFVIHQGKLNAFWLQKYLVHLRFSKRSMSASRSRVNGLEGDIDEVRNSAEGVDLLESSEGAKLFDFSPIDFSQWLDKEVSEGKQSLATKSSDFQRALAGQPHALTREELGLTLERMDIVPTVIMDLIIKQKVQAFVLDANGRRDYQWQMKNEVIKWSTENRVDWAKVPEVRKSELRTQFRNKMITDKTEDIYSSERSNASVTKELFWKYDGECRDLNYKHTVTWGEWLQRYIEDDKEKLAFLRKYSADRRAIARAEIEKQRAVATLVDVEDKLKKAAENVSTFHSMDLRKCLITLRRAAASASKGDGKNVLLSKNEFDRHMREVLAPRLRELPDELKYLAKCSYRDGPYAFSPSKSKSRARSAERQSECEDPLFLRTEDEQLERMIKSDELKEVMEFNQWLERKREAKLNMIRLKRSVEEQKDEEMHRREKESKKAYRLWLKMHRKKKYISQVDGKAHALPFGPSVRHSERWHIESNARYSPGYTPKEGARKAKKMGATDGGGIGREGGTEASHARLKMQKKRPC